jgi:hypothetical protein
MEHSLVAQMELQAALHALVQVVVAVLFDKTLQLQAQFLHYLLTRLQLLHLEFYSMKLAHHSIESPVLQPMYRQSLHLLQAIQLQN